MKQRYLRNGNRYRFRTKEEHNICKLYKTGVSSCGIGHWYNCPPSTICRIVKRYGISLGKVGKPRKDITENFCSKFEKIPDGCWEWQAKIHKKTGYGHFSTYVNAKRKTYLAHRFSYELYIGPIPKKLTVDHICRNRKCVKRY